MSRGRGDNLVLVRIVLALAVLVSHVWPLSGRGADPYVGWYSLGGIAVTGFFLLSGVLVTRSWILGPSLPAFAVKRAGRLLPGLWACLALTAIVLLPIAAWLERDDTPAGIGSLVTYPFKNALLYTGQTSVDGLLDSLPYANVVNGSLYTLTYETACYVGVACLGLIGLVRPFRLGAVALALWGLDVALSLAPSLNLNAGSAYNLAGVAQFGLAFAMGAWWYRAGQPLPGAAGRTVVAVTGTLALFASGTAAAVVRPIVLSGLLVVLWSLAFHTPAWRGGAVPDLSYGLYLYAFPVTQLVVTASGAKWGVVPTALATILVTGALATSSWYAVERPALSAVRRRARHPRRPGAGMPPDRAGDTAAQVRGGDGGGTSA